MDPRLQRPSASQGPPPMQDIRPVRQAAPEPVAPPVQASTLQPVPAAPSEPPAAAPAPTSDVPSSVHDIPVAGYEVVESIPVAQPAQLAPVAVAAAPSMVPHANPIQESEDELDKILQAVNNRVQKPLTPQKNKSKVLSKVAEKAAKAKPSSGAKPILPVVVVVLVAIGLSAAAVMAYRQGDNKGLLSGKAGTVGTTYQASASIQAAGGTLVRPSDLDDFSQTLSQQLNGLNDKDDFDSSSLSDQVLGL